MAAKKDDKASVLAFEKKLVPSDGYLYGTTWKERYTKAEPLELREKSVRGTISNRLKKALQDDPMKLDAEVEKANLQTVDSCALLPEHDTLKLSFTLKILSGVETPSACNNANFQASYQEVVKNYIAENGFTELAKRYATNIANGRFLWRNRVGAEQLEIHVKVSNSETQWTFDASQISVQNFNTPTADVLSLAEKIAEALSGKTEFLLLEINAFAQIGSAQDVYPSEELVLDKGNSKSKKSKILYHVKNQAALHSQKIGNALRTIDTWYPEFSSETAQAGDLFAAEKLAHGKPIAIEPYGAVTNLGRAFRTPKEKVDFFTLFDKFARGHDLNDKNAEHYVMAVLVRGGVFGESEKE
jgi:CRISPR-associated protein Csy3